MKPLSFHIAIIILFLLVLASILCAAEGDSLWSRTYGGARNDWPGSVIQDAAGDLLQAGTTFSFGAGDGDMWLIKTSPMGDSLWSRTFGGKGWDGANAVIQTREGGYLLAGGTNSFGAGNKDMWMVKTNSSGDSLWSRTFGGKLEEEAGSVIRTDDGGYLLAGYTFSFGKGKGDIWLIKTDAAGDSLWSRTFGGKKWDATRTIIQTDDGGYVLVGRTGSFGAGDFDYWLLKTDLEGNLLWSRTFGGKKGEGPNCLIQSNDGDYLIAGRTSSFGAGDYDVWLVKTDADGDSLWSGAFGGKLADIATAVVQADDGGYLVGGITRSFGAGDTDIWLLKIDSKGDSLWSRTFGGAGWDRAYAIIQAREGNYLVAGGTADFGADSLDLWLLSLKGPPASDNAPVQTYPSQFLLCPPSFKPFNPVKVIRFDLPTACLAQLDILDVSKHAVGTHRNMSWHEGWLEAGIHKITFDGSKLPSGIYFIQLRAGDFRQVQKLVLIK